MTFFKSFVAAAMVLMAAGYCTAGPAVFARAGETVTVVKAASGFWVVKKV